MKKAVAILLTGVMVFSLSACTINLSGTGVETDAPEETSVEEETGLANPVSEITADEFTELAWWSFAVPEGASNVKYSRIGDGERPVVQMNFDLDGLNFNARAQLTGDNFEDISGMNYEWTDTSDVKLATWRDGEMSATYSRYVGDDEQADLITWYDIEIGISFSLSVVSDDLDGVDTQAVAEALYDPSNIAGFSEEAEETEEHVPMDITGCDTFTQIVDKLPVGNGYANATVGDTDVLLVTDYTYDNGGYQAAIDSDIYYYDEDGVPTYLGYVTSAGTAYPVAIKDGILYVAGNHFASKYTVENGKLIRQEQAWVEYDSDGNATYFVSSDPDTPDITDGEDVSDDSALNKLYDEMFDGEVVQYDVIK